MSQNADTRRDGPHKSAAFLVLLALLIALLFLAARLTAVGPYGQDLRRMGERLVQRMIPPPPPSFQRPVRR